MFVLYIWRVILFREVKCGRIWGFLCECCDICLNVFFEGLCFFFLEVSNELFWFVVVFWGFFKLNFVIINYYEVCGWFGYCVCGVYICLYDSLLEVRDLEWGGLCDVWYLERLRSCGSVN